MINGFDSYKLSINNLNDVNADTVNSNTDNTTSLYVNGQLINFSSYVTSSYLSTTLTNYITSSFLTSTLSSYVLASNLSSQLSNYVLSSTLSSTLSNYATISYVNSQLSNYASNGALSSYRLISDSYAKWEVDNMVAGLSAGITANGVAITGVVASLAVTNATVAGLVTNVSTLNGQVTTIDGQITTLQGKTQNQTATAGNTKFTGTLQMTTGVNNNITLNNNGDITCLTETVNTLTCNTEIKGNGQLNLTNATQDHILKGNSLSLSAAGKDTSIYGNSYIGAIGSIVQLYGDNVNINNSNSFSNLTTTTIGGLFQTIYLNGAVYINGKLVTGFGIGPTNGQWSFPNV
jgi:hypothetical protein